MNKRGISSIVATVLIILLVVASSVVVWMSIDLLTGGDLEYENTRVEIVTIEGYTLFDESSDRLSVHLKRTGGATDIAAMDFIVSFGGNSVVKRVSEVLEDGEKKVYTFCINEDLEPSAVRLSLVKENGKIGDARTNLKQIPDGKLADPLPECIPLFEETKVSYEPLPATETEYDMPIIEFSGGLKGLNKALLNESTLVVYNKNYVDGLEIAEYYAEKRYIDDKYLCEVSLPTGQLTDGQYFMGARNTIINDCICDLIDVSGCSVDKMDDVVESSPITHLVFIKGIPPRITGVDHLESCAMGCYGGREEPSFGHFMSFFLYKDESIFDYTEGCSTRDISYQGRFPLEIFDVAKESWAGYIRPSSPNKDRAVSYGFVEAMNTERTKDLIDRTLEAEKEGVYGTFVYSEDGTLSDYDKEYKFLKDLTSTHECLDYVENDVAGDYENNCRLAVNDEGRIPGESYGNINKILDATIYIGDSHGHNAAGNLVNGHNAFDGFLNMLNWHKDSVSCTELCQDMPSQQSIDNCRASSTDYFKEINTDCVGVAKGFIGWQYRSWPVQYYGFWPHGWSHLSGGNGQYEKTPPLVLEEAGNDYLHYGAIDAVENPKCFDEAGATKDCPEYIGVNLRQSVRFNSSVYNHTTYNAPLTLEEDHIFSLTISHKNPGNDNARLRPYIIVYFTDGEREVISQYLYLNEESTDWKTDTLFYESLEGAGKEVRYILLDITSYENYPIENWLELDDIQLYDHTNSVLVSNEEMGEFSLPNMMTTPGDYASNAIDRLGGIAWWGSASHVATGGHAFNNPYRMLGSFYSGYSLGESLLHNSVYGVSAIIYGDPLYNPSGVKLFVNDSYSYLNDKSTGYVFITEDIENVSLYANAFNGWENANETLWDIDLCGYISNEDESYECSTEKGWFKVANGTGAVFNQLIFEGMQNFTNETDKPYYFKFRLRVWNPGREDEDMTSYAFFYYEPDTDEDSLSDLFEYHYFQGYDWTGEDDPDNDGFTNREEFLNKKSPNYETNYPQCYLESHCPDSKPDCLKYTCSQCSTDLTCIANSPDMPYCVYGYCRSCYFKHTEPDQECYDVFGSEFPFCYTVFCKECEENSDCQAKYPDGSKGFCSDSGDCTSCYGTEVTSAEGCPEEFPDCRYNTCVGCIENETCEANNDGLDFCVNMQCAECLVDDDCATRHPDGSKSACVFNSCVECNSHDQCEEDEYCWLNNSCAKISCTIDSDCEDFGDCSLDECIEGYCKFTRFEDSEDCLYCANLSYQWSMVGGFNLTGGGDFDRNGSVGDEDVDILRYYYGNGFTCNETNNFCDYADANRNQKYTFSRFVGGGVNSIDLIPILLRYQEDCKTEDIYN